LGYFGDVGTLNQPICFVIIPIVLLLIRKYRLCYFVIWYSKWFPQRETDYLHNGTGCSTTRTCWL